jgi:pheromone shutdown protein TraB
MPDARTVAAITHRYMVWQLGAQCPRGKVVVVVGMAHMDGIEKEWREKHQENGRRDQ